MSHLPLVAVVARMTRVLVEMAIMAVREAQAGRQILPAALSTTVVAVVEAGLVATVTAESAAAAQPLARKMNLARMDKKIRVAVAVER